MPAGLITTFVKRLNDGVDEWNERMEDAETGRRNKYGLKTHKWYEEEDRKKEERKKQQKERHRRHRHHRRGSKERGEHGERGGPREEDLMSGANEDAAQDHEREQPGDGEGHVVAAEERPRRRRRRHRSRPREDNDNASIHQSRSRSREHDNRSEHRRARGEDISSIEILERTNVPYGRELPPQDGAPQPHGPPQMLAPWGANGPPAEDREKNAGNRRRGPQAQPPRHPDMKSYDGGGFMSLVKAIRINLVQERQRRRDEAKTSNGGRKDEEKRRERQERDKERRRRRQRSRGRSPVRPRAPGGEGAEGHDQSGVNRPGGRAHSEERLPDTNGPALEAEHSQAEEMEHRHHEPLINSATGAVYGQAAEMDAGHAHGQAAHLAGSRAPSSHRDVSPLSTVHENRDHSTADPMGSTISSMPPSTIGEPQSRPHGHTSRISDIDPSATGTSSRRASVAGSTNTFPESTSRSRGRQRERPVEATDSESGYSGHEGDRSVASTRASIRSPRSTPPSSRTSTSGARGGSSGRGRGGGQGRGTRPRGGAGYDDDVGGEYYNLHESYDDEYDCPGRFFDARPLRNDYQPFPQPGCRFSHSSFRNASHTNQGSYNQGFSHYGPVLVQSPGTTTWVTMAQYQSYLQHRPRFTQSTTTASCEKLGRTDPHGPGWSGGDDHPSKRRGGDGKANEEHGRHRRRRDYDSSDSSDTNSSDLSDTDSSSSSDDNSRTRKPPKPRSSHDEKYKSKSQVESNIKFRSSSDTRYPSRRDTPKPSDRRSPRPYARNETRAPKSRKRHPDGRSPRPYARNQNRASESRENHSDTNSISETDSERENDSKPRFSARDDGYDSFEDSNTDRRSKPKSKPKPRANSESTRKSKPKAKPSGRRRSHSDSSDAEWDGEDEREGYPSAPAIPEKPMDFYAVIGLPKTASAAEIKIALRKIWLAVHPDKIDDSAMTEAQKQRCRDRAANVGQATEIFKDEDRKREYDRSVEVWERFLKIITIEMLSSWFSSKNSVEERESERERGKEEAETLIPLNGFWNHGFGVG